MIKAIKQNNSQNPSPTKWPDAVTASYVNTWYSVLLIVTLTKRTIQHKAIHILPPFFMEIEQLNLLFFLVDKANKFEECSRMFESNFQCVKFHKKCWNLIFNTVINLTSLAWFSSNFCIIGNDFLGGQFPHYTKYEQS